MEKTNFLFNEASEANWVKLKPEEQQFVVKNREEALKEVLALRADHLANRDQRIADEEKRIAGQPKPALNLKPPGFTEQHKRSRSAADIRADAESRVEKAYTQRRQDIIKEGKKKEREYVKTALGIEPRGPDGPDHGIDRRH